MGTSAAVDVVETIAVRLFPLTRAVKSDPLDSARHLFE